MSKSIRVALVVEGPTDALMIEYALTSIWGKEVSIECITIQPETLPQNILGNAETIYETPGWKGVCVWCQNLGAKGLSGDIFAIAELQYDMLIIQLDADVAEKRYADCGLPENATTPLPVMCDMSHLEHAHCLEEYIAKWLEPVTMGDTTVLCIPSYTLETWTCVGKNPQENLSTASKNVEERTDLVGRIGKRPRKYRTLKNTLITHWPHVEKHCSQAKKFGDAVRACPVSQLSSNH